MKTILLGEILNKNTSLRKSLGPFTKVLYDVEKSIPFNLRYNFYNNLSTLKVQLNLDKTKILKNFYSFGIYDANENKIIIEEAIGAYTEMHITLLMKDAKAPYEATKEGVEKFLSEISLEDEFVATLENENGQIFEESISSSDGKGGMSQHPNGDVTLYLTFPITKDEYTDTLKLNITTRDKTMVVNLSK